MCTFAWMVLCIIMRAFRAMQVAELDEWMGCAGTATRRRYDSPAALITIRTAPEG
jgi:hypothetical protein